MVTTPHYDLDIDTTLGGSNASDYIIPSQKAIKSYVDNNSGSTVDQTYDGTSANAQSGVAIAGELAKYPQKAQDEEITGVYNFKGQKKIKFTQSGSSDKLGFTLYNNSNVEKGYLEYNPSNTVDNVPLMTLGNYATASAGLTHVGFRKYSSVSGSSGAYNLLAPLISDARTPFNLTTTYTNFYMPLGFTDGTTTIKTAKTGLVDFSSFGYTKNVGTVTKVNNTSPDANGNVSITIPVVNNATLTIQKNGTTVNTFTANASSNVTANITVPTKISDLTDDTSTNPINKADTLTGLTASITELNYCDGVTSSIQTQLNGKSNTDLSNISASGQSVIDNSIIAILTTLYPVGSVYIGTMATCPLQTLGIGTWQLVSSGRVLQGSDSNNVAGSTVNASLPSLTTDSQGDHSHNRGTMNISGGPITVGRFTSTNNTTVGALSTKHGTSRTTGYDTSRTSYDSVLTLTASSNWSGTTNTTGSHTHTAEWTDHVGTTVQPDAYIVNIWERIA